MAGSENRKEENVAEEIPPTLNHLSALRFWLAVILTGIGVGVSQAMRQPSAN